MDEVELKLWDACWETCFAVRGPIDKPWHPVDNKTYCTAPTRLASPVAKEDSSSDTQPFPEGFDFATMLDIHYRLRELNDRKRNGGQQRASNKYRGQAPSTSPNDSSFDTTTDFEGTNAHEVVESKHIDSSANKLEGQGLDNQRKRTWLYPVSDSSYQDRVTAETDHTVAEDIHSSSCPSDLLTAMGLTPLQQPPKAHQGYRSSWVPPSLYGPPSPFLSAVEYPSVLMQPYYEDLTHGPVNQHGSSPVLQPTKAELSFFQGAVAPTLEHLPPPRYAIGEYPELFTPDSISDVGKEQVGSPVAFTLEASDDTLSSPAREHVRKSKQRPRSKIRETYGYHPALQYLWEPELEVAKKEFAMADYPSEGLGSAEEEYYDGRWGPRTPTRPTTTYEDISAGGDTPTTYVEDLPFHACYDDILVPRKYPKFTTPIFYEEPSPNPEDSYEWMDRKYREAQQLPKRGLDFDGNPVGFPIPKELKRPRPPLTPVIEENLMNAYIAQASYITRDAKNESLEWPEYMEQVLRDYRVDDSPTSSTQAHPAASSKRKMGVDDTKQRKKARVSVNRFEESVLQPTPTHQQVEDLEYTQTITESFSQESGNQIAIRTGWELRRRANASFRNQRKGRVFSRSQSPSPPSIAGKDSRLINEGEPLLDALSEASSGDPTLLDKGQESQIPEAENPYLSDKEISQRPLQPAETQHKGPQYDDPTNGLSNPLNQSDQPIQQPVAMPQQKPEVVVPTLSPELRDQYVEYVYYSKKNKGASAKGGSRLPRGSSASGQKQKTRKRILLKCDRVTRSTPKQDKQLLKLDMKGKQAEAWDGKRDSSGGSPTKRVRAGQSSCKEPVTRVLSKTRRVTKRITQTC